MGDKIVLHSKGIFEVANADDPLLSWFGNRNAGAIRSLEVSIREHLIGALTLGHTHRNLDHLSSLAAANYVALFSVFAN